jgi:histone-binding protein RBBP4
MTDNSMSIDTHANTPNNNNNIDSDDHEQQLINEEYRIWKKNSPYLYDYLSSHNLDWPSLTIQWLPYTVIPDRKDYTIHRLIAGTHTSGSEANYLLFADVKIPLFDHEIEPTAAATNKNKTNSGNNINNPITNVDEEEGSYGGKSASFDIIQSIPVGLSEVNRARYMWQNPNMIALRLGNNNNNVYIVDRTCHPSKPDPSSINKPNFQLTLQGHTAEGYGVCWNYQTEGHLLTSADDGLVAAWNINSATKDIRAIQPITLYNFHGSVVNDVQYHPLHSSLFASVSDDRTVCVADTRNNTKTAANKSKPNQIFRDNSEINCLAFNSYQEYVFLTGSQDGSIKLYDLRSAKAALHHMNYHKESILNLATSPHSCDVFAACSSDRRVSVWDLSRLGASLSEEERAEGPPELLFVHGGHTDSVSDMAWNYSADENWMVASVADDNILQVWQIAENIHAEQDQIDNNIEDSNESK